MASESAIEAGQRTDPASQSQQSSRSASVRKSPSDSVISSLSRKRQRLIDGEYRESSHPPEDQATTPKKPMQPRPSAANPVQSSSSTQALQRSPIIQPVPAQRSAAGPESRMIGQVIQSIEVDGASTPLAQSGQAPGDMDSEPIILASSSSGSPRIEAGDLEDIEPDLPTVLSLEDDGFVDGPEEQWPQLSFLGPHANTAQGFARLVDRIKRSPDALSYLNNVSQWIADFCAWAATSPELARSLICTRYEIFEGIGRIAIAFKDREYQFGRNLSGDYIVDVIHQFYSQFADLFIIIYAASLAILRGQMPKEFSSTTASLPVAQYLPYLLDTVATRQVHLMCRRVHNIKQEDISLGGIDRIASALAMKLLDWDELLKAILEKTEPTPESITWFSRAITLIQLNALTVKSYDKNQEDDVSLPGSELPDLITSSICTYDTVEKYFCRALDERRRVVGTVHEHTELMGELYQLHSIICQLDLQNARDYLKLRDLDSAHLTDDEALEASVVVSKCYLLKSMICMDKMEYRVYGIDATAELLASIYRKRLGMVAKAFDDPVLLIIAQFLEKQKLIAYLVGSQSHPELTKHSTNIVAFLVVTGRFTPLIADEIWSDMTGTSNPRTREAIIQLLDDMQTNSMWGDVQYRCKQICKLPPEQLDSKMCRHAFRTLDFALTKCREQGHTTTRAMIDLTVRLLRHSTAHDTNNRQGMDEYTFRTAHDKLSYCLQWSPAPADVHAVMEECGHDLKDKTSTTTGSLQAMTLLLQHMKHVESNANPIRRLFSTHMLVHHYATELEAAFSKELAKEGRVPVNEMVQKVRLCMLGEIILAAPDSITGDDEKIIVAHMFGDRVLFDQYRQSFWQQMNHLVMNLSTRNSWLVRLRDVYLNELPKQYMSLEVLDFIAQMTLLDAQLLKSEPVAENQILQISSRELLWRIILQAADDRVSKKAIKILLMSLEDVRIRKDAPASAIAETYKTIIQQGVEKLIDCAHSVTALGEEAEVGSTSLERKRILTEDLELQFRRAILLLGELLTNFKAKDPVKASPPSGKASPELYGGTPIVINWQASTTKSTSEIESLTINGDSPLAALQKRLRVATGFAKFDLFFKGKKFELGPDELRILVKDSDLVSGHLLLVRKGYSPGETEDAGGKLLSKMDIEVLKHFDSFYELLALPLNFSKALYEFLQRFPTQELITSKVISPSTTLAELFEVNKVYKCLYTIDCMQAVLADQLILDTNYIALSFYRLSQALQEVNLKEGEIGQMQYTYVARLVVSMLLFAKEAPDASMSGLDRAAKLRTMHCLLEIIESCTAPIAVRSPYAGETACRTFAILLELTLVDGDIMDEIIRTDSFRNQVQGILISDPRHWVRRAADTHIAAVCQAQSRSAVTPVHRMITIVWSILHPLLSAALARPSFSADYFNASRTVLDSMFREEIPGVQYDQYIEQWTEVLEHVDHHEIIGNATRDPLVFGLNLLLKGCILGVRGQKRQPSLRPLALVLVKHFLFPNPATLDLGDEVKAVTPVMEEHSRVLLYENLRLCCHDPEIAQEVLNSMLVDLIEVDVPNDWSYDVWKSLRSDTGYVGTINLSNTCYSNSLFTQLYMNIPFREFVLSLDIPDHPNHGLVFELRKMFAEMQTTWQQAANPECVIGSIKNWESQSIDPTVQMDADEFYNLLADRLENQLPTPEDQRKFRRFYGGQYVHQIKSKECGHVSEREESFQAIQVEIKGKVSLEEGLNAFVQGEVLEGDNKYRCGTCDQKVDAVKRICLRDLPESLIFHLKRFDFDLRTMTRSKINDQFAFHESIDMTPYTIEHLNDPEGVCQPDIYDLVGVLVHSGTAESGHYYSYIRERPSAPHSQSPRWLEFNDMDVSPLNFAHLANYSYGGMEQNVLPGFAYPMAKIYSAYMLFYERRSTLQKKQHIQDEQRLSVPIHIPIPRELTENTTVENASVIRYHCFHIDAHMHFTQNLITRLGTNKPMGCTGDHRLEKLGIAVVMTHLDRIVSRISWDNKTSKNRPRHLDDTMMALHRFLGQCSHCRGLVLSWFCDNRLALEGLLIRCPKLAVRMSVKDLLTDCLHEYSSLHEDDESREDYENGLREFVSLLYQAWMGTGQLSSKNWTEYFHLLKYVTKMGVFEAGEILRFGYLARCFTMMILDNSTRVPRDLEKLAKGWSKKKPAWAGVIELASALFQYIDLSLPHDNDLPDDEERVLQGPDEHGRYPLARGENILYRAWNRHGGDTRTLKLVDRMLSIEIVPRSEAVHRAIYLFIARCAEADPNSSFVRGVRETIAEGLYTEPADQCDSYLRAAVSFCEYTPRREAVTLLMRDVRNAFKQMPADGGNALLNYYKMIVKTQNRYFEGENAWMMRRFAIETALDWAPNLLLYFGDAMVRDEAETFVREGIFDGFPGAGTLRPLLPVPEATNQAEATGEQPTTTIPHNEVVVPITANEAVTQQTTTAATDADTQMSTETQPSEDQLISSTAVEPPSSPHPAPAQPVYPTAIPRDPSGLTQSQKRISGMRVYLDLIERCHRQIRKMVIKTLDKGGDNAPECIPTGLGPIMLSLLRDLGDLLNNAAMTIVGLEGYLGREAVNAESARYLAREAERIGGHHASSSITNSSLSGSNVAQTIEGESSPHLTTAATASSTSSRPTAPKSPAEQARRYDDEWRMLSLKERALKVQEVVSLGVSLSAEGDVLGLSDDEDEGTGHRILHPSSSPPPLSPPPGNGKIRLRYAAANRIPHGTIEMENNEWSSELSSITITSDEADDVAEGVIGPMLREWMDETETGDEESEMGGFVPLL